MLTHKKAKSLNTVSPQFKLASISLKKPQIKLKKSTRINQRSLFIGDKEKILFNLISKRPKSGGKLQKSLEKYSETRRNTEEKELVASNKIQIFQYSALNSKHYHSPNHYYPDFLIAGSPNPPNIQKLRSYSNKKKNLINIDSALMISKKKISYPTSAQSQYLSF